MKRHLSLLLVAALLLPILCLSGCKGNPLPDGMDSDQMIAVGEDIVSMLNEADYQGVADAFRPDMAEEYAVSADKIRDIMDTVSAAGTFVKITDTLTAGGQNDSYSEPYGVVVLYCKHTSKNVIYSISLDPDLSLIGLEVKKK